MTRANENAAGGMLTFDTDTVQFELGVAGTHWTHDGLRPQLRFIFDAGHAVAAVQGAPARSVACTPESFALIPPGMQLRVQHASPLEILALTFATDALAGRADPSAGVGAAAGGLPIPTIDLGVRALAVEARRVLVEEPSPDPGYLAALGQAMLARALQVIEQGAPVRVAAALSPFRLRRVVDHVEARLDSKISVQDLAELANLSAAHFTRAFRQATGEAPHHFVLSRRIARVRELLREPALDLSTVAVRTGFSSHAHMTSAFRRLIGLTPAAYRASVARRLAS
jgi:AraC family transcriptional regulator